MDTVTNRPFIDQILSSWKQQIGDTYEGYRGHVYRMFNCCLALKPYSDEEKTKLASAQVYEVESASPPLLLFLPASELRTAGEVDVLAGLVYAGS